ncbi:Cytochrome c [Thalassoglobus neptunius]|uniref:Cytochrome c n=1 Tax=Thalassoglobus neptunius TaxID=1938619 RepID=A0A5C5VSR1_9PLAN|nr:PVC-type heme-binding CxxCH protein [Thalassoglobus neptunius]TWT40612.1 Cytochrome c [Thalassoglobus neptunius]
MKRLIMSECVPQRFFMSRAYGTLLSVLLLACSMTLADDLIPVNTQAVDEHPLPPEQAVKRLRVPTGFQVTLAAAEPDVRQPIAITFDDRGRLWVAESYSYNGSSFTDETNDRILIFEDTTGDGILNKRHVFCDRLTHLTGLEIGFGGVWITAPPCLSFIPDRDHDDVPDGPPIIHLDGWNVNAEHNNVNGLEWGPDGWLYGRHGIKQPSLVGKPDFNNEERVELSCCIWRYHPTSNDFEIVNDGTINPWGLDFDEHGHGFFSTSVVEHLWPLIPGAHYERWKERNDHPNPYAYELMTSMCDHVHWASRMFDKQSRVAEGNAAHGGGHSHCDAMIYLGGHWPNEYRGAMLMSNIHGRRINCDRLVQDEHGFRAIHDEDFMLVDDPWFRAVSMEYGPDGDVYLTDWSDNGECHDRDGVHRTSGRVYKISWGRPRLVSVNLIESTNEELIANLSNANQWYVRHSQRILQERAAAGDDMRAAIRQIEQMCDEAKTPALRLRALWALHSIDGLRKERLTAQLKHESEHVRSWALRLLADREQLGSVDPQLLKTIALSDSSPLVQLSFASSIRKLSVGNRQPFILSLARQRSGWDNANLQRMIWYAIEPEVAADPVRFLNQRSNVSPLLQRWIIRRVCEKTAPSTELLFTQISREASPKQIVAYLDGINDASVESIELTEESELKVNEWTRHTNANVRLASIRLAVKVGGDIFRSLRPLLHDHATDPKTAEAILSGMVQHQTDSLSQDVKALIQTRHLTVQALRAAASVKDATVIDTILATYGDLTDYERSAAIDVLVSRKSSVKRLLSLMEQDAIPASDLSAAQVQQVNALRDRTLSQRLEKLWGSVRSSSADRTARIRKLESQLSSDFLREADLAAGRALFAESCGKCHKLFGKGTTLGPDLTGSQRGNLNYLLSNIIDPGAAVPADFRMSVIVTVDGRVVSGVITKQSKSGVTVRTANETIHIQQDDIDVLRKTSTSIMPDGLVDKLSKEQTRDLIAWIMSDGAIGAEETGFVSIFNGKDLKGWNGKPQAWEVREGAIWCTGKSKEKNWLIWRGAEPSDFVLRMEFLWDQGNSGVQVRSDDLGSWMVSGYQVEVAEQDVMGLWHHSLLDNDHPRKGVRHLMATAGQSVVLKSDGTKDVRREADANRVRQGFREHGWNELEIIASGDKLVQKINGVVFAVVTDQDPKMSRQKGFIAIQDHGKGCRVAFRNIRIQEMDAPSSE